ncbi:undecaprenyl-diphosphate phosphatase [Salinibacillus xinjiangensis]|uniref:Undecaprenyl-diphosphatase n=1 Tax=Salinibacillus xinjiangensis TaxID=1229268 RepID=A0A6G1X7Z4_9BACI|nr:undecaprenyl-diphosphate phosphatase [Salinibacillus xinjiangensis]MRG87062.1 TSUP family transporter [Salinibacillus xinjiangensis]
MNDLWVLLQYLFLGLFQGFTEPIPISSSGHLVLVRQFMELDLDITFEGFLNFGSLIAVLIIYRKDIIRLTTNSLSYVFKKNKDGANDFRFVLFLIIATIPAGVLGVLLEDWISKTFNEGLRAVGIALLVTGIALWIIRNIRGHKGEAEVTAKDAIIIGLAQAVALMPGISRSGATIVGAMLLGLKQETALRFSFLLYIPVSLGTMIFSVKDMVGAGTFQTLWIPLVVGLIGAIVASYYALLWFMNIMKNGNLKYFAFYCFAISAIILLFLA